MNSNNNKQKLTDDGSTEKAGVDYLTAALVSGELQAQLMLKNGTPEQQILARRYLDCVENMRSYYQKPYQP